VFIVIFQFADTRQSDNPTSSRQKFAVCPVHFEISCKQKIDTVSYTIHLPLGKMLEARRGYFPPNEIKPLQLHLLPFRDEKFISKAMAINFKEL